MTNNLIKTEGIRLFWSKKWFVIVNVPSCTYHRMNLEYVTEVVLCRFVILGNVGKVGEIVGILAGPVNIANLMLADGLLSSGIDRTESNRRNGNRGVENSMARAVSPVDACAVGKRAPDEGAYKCRPFYYHLLRIHRLYRDAL
jgi:hypothetical protein